MEEVLIKLTEDKLIFESSKTYEIKANGIFSLGKYIILVKEGLYNVHNYVPDGPAGFDKKPIASFRDLIDLVEYVFGVQIKKDIKYIKQKVLLQQDQAWIYLEAENRGGLKKGIYTFHVKEGIVKEWFLKYNSTVKYDYLFGGIFVLGSEIMLNDRPKDGPAIVIKGEDKREIMQYSGYFSLTDEYNYYRNGFEIVDLLEVSKEKHVLLMSNHKEGYTKKFDWVDGIGTLGSTITYVGYKPSLYKDGVLTILGRNLYYWDTGLKDLGQVKDFTVFRY